jgi:hypothetical protein
MERPSMFPEASVLLAAVINGLAVVCGRCWAFGTLAGRPHSECPFRTLFCRRICACQYISAPLQFGVRANPLSRGMAQYFGMATLGPQACHSVFGSRTEGAARRLGQPAQNFGCDLDHARNYCGRNALTCRPVSMYTGAFVVGNGSAKGRIHHLSGHAAS